MQAQINAKSDNKSDTRRSGSGGRSAAAAAAAAAVEGGGAAELSRPRRAKRMPTALQDHMLAIPWKKGNHLVRGALIAFA
jgi:hypothetical protein